MFLSATLLIYQNNPFIFLPPPPPQLKFKGGFLSKIWVLQVPRSNLGENDSYAFIRDCRSHLNVNVKSNFDYTVCYSTCQNKQKM